MRPYRARGHQYSFWRHDAGLRWWQTGRDNTLIDAGVIGGYADRSQSKGLDAGSYRRRRALRST